MSGLPLVAGSRRANTWCHDSHHRVLRVPRPHRRRHPAQSRPPEVFPAIIRWPFRTRYDRDRPRCRTHSTRPSRGGSQVSFDTAQRAGLHCQDVCRTKQADALRAKECARSIRAVSAGPTCTVHIGPPRRPERRAAVHLVRPAGDPAGVVRVGGLRVGRRGTGCGAGRQLPAAAAGRRSVWSRTRSERRYAEHTDPPR